MSFPAGNSGWNNNVQRTYFSSNSNGNKANQNLKKDLKKENSENIDLEDEVYNELNVEFKKSIFELLWEFILSIFRMIFKIKNNDDKSIQEQDSFEKSK